ncbi:MAG TPA: NAD(P)H-dependent oxidoreductase [Methylibium sp.]|uniref:NADPH-dependent FMN reductase n=1 Tax=Methylibium sp. TaxID=2067992 RepID=UPI002DBB70A4|nr:NAD(P)H-dependent oxidoreductase [Methylibium sp.]HEU4457593.1 NAD(P)H-dependent oxidoreductase [Methylibium sp.]
MSKVLVIPGSQRKGSLNLQLATLVAERLKQHQAQPTLVDLRALALPIYDGDLEAEQGVPVGAKALVEQFAASDAVVVVSPEYNAFPPPLLMNAIDWATRVPEHKTAMGGKPCLLASASPGALGGLRSLLALRQFLALNPGLVVMPMQFGLPQANKAWAGDTLADAKQLATLDGALQALVDAAAKLRSR